MKNSDTHIDWQPGLPPEKEGVYLVWLKNKKLGTHVQVMTRRQSGGKALMDVIGSLFAWDVLGGRDNQEILAWAEIGNPPNFELFSK